VAGSHAASQLFFTLNWKTYGTSVNEKQIRAAAANDDGGANFTAGQIREWNRKENDVISRAIH
jgi:hypothetical protein